MSSFAYGVLTARRVAADAFESEGEQPPGTKPYVDIFAALVPAEVLAVWASVVVANTTMAAQTKAGKSATVISDPGLMKGTFFALLVVSSVLYVIGRIRGAAWDWGPDLVRLLIPPVAFTGWMMLQRPGVFDLLTPDWANGSREVAASVGAVVVAAIASLLAYQANANPPKQPNRVTTALRGRAEVLATTSKEAMHD